MCGITGIFSYTDPQRAWPRPAFEDMLKRITHRGPDDNGIYEGPGVFIGHTRLAVIDLSPAGHQPMFTADKKWVISYNGEIYNYKEIRRELENAGHHFISQSDTEVLLVAWQQWGESCIEKLDGIFAFALYDITERELFLVRDHLGVKPLFYMMKGGQVFFASELMGLFGPLNPCPEFDDEALDSYFTFNYLSSSRTGLKGAYQLPPGSILTVNVNGETLKRYWRPEYKPQTGPWLPCMAGRFEELLHSVVKRQLVSDAPLGLFLSGGLDSFSVALSAVASGDHPVAFTMGFEEKGFNEIPAAKEYARHLELQSETLMFSWAENDIHDTLGAMSELLADASFFPIYQLTKFARKKVTVALAGDGGDELLAGYDTYRAGEVTPYIGMLPQSLKRMMRGIASRFPSGNSRYGWRMVVNRFFDAADEGRGRDHASFRRIFNPAMKKRLYARDLFKATAGFDPVGEYAGLMKEVPEERSYLTARQHADMMFHLPAILAKVDRASMANGLEVRVPLLSKQMVEFCINLPDEAKQFKGKGKRILRKAIAGRVPRGTLVRPKAGFLPPVDFWFRSNGAMKNVFGDHLAAARTSLGFLQWREVDKLWEEHRQGRVDAGFILLGILQFINWSHKCRKCSNT